MTQELKFTETTIPVGEEEVIQEVPVEEVTEAVENSTVEEVGNQTGIQDKSFEALMTLTLFYKTSVVCVKNMVSAL